MLCTGVAALIVAAYVKMAAPIISKIDFLKPCVPFAQKEVPNENDGNWIRGDASITTYENTPLNEWNEYSHKTLKGLKLSVYSFFGQTAFKAWACRPNGETGDMPDHMIAILKDGKWYSAYAQAPIFASIEDENGVTIYLKIRLFNSNNKLIVERIFTRHK